ncbi:MAG: sulfite exporter TauE/SafE family protein [Armatimonadetes bacterium]|nr:sulfite exporter TauE/SafE family protein [Armatimonadota bacterium]
MTWIVVIPIVFAAATLGGVLGFGTGVIVLALLTLMVGAAEAIPVLAIAMIFANGSRAFFSWKEIDWKAFIAYGVPGAVSSVLGAEVFLRIEARWLPAIVGALIIAMVPLRRFVKRWNVKAGLVHLPFVALAKGFVSGVGGASGPIAAPFLISYGLVKGAYVATEGLGAMLGHVTRSGTYFFGGALTQEMAWFGLGLGVVMVGGTYVGRKVLDRLDARQFIVVVEGALLAAGVYLLASTLWAG